MSTKKVRILAAAMAGGLVLTGVTAAVIAHTGHAPSREVLAADTAPLSPVNLDNCPTLAEGYHGGCVNQLQTELKAIDNPGLTVDGTFGPSTKQAVVMFQQQNGIPADGIVGPQTKAALDDDTGQASVTTPGPGAPLPLPSESLSPGSGPDWCLASTSSPCPPQGLDDHGEADGEAGDLAPTGLDQIAELISGLF